ncbi:uncharacterized protein [Littorina saxatilis]|uniref:Uncharacterized protein n=1 Tax=Littorina saxatilis TaxID=31220 RepID=A0AAN9ARA9_9CAEN
MIAVLILATCFSAVLSQGFYPGYGGQFGQNGQFGQYGGFGQYPCNPYSYGGGQNQQCRRVGLQCSPGSQFGQQTCCPGSVCRLSAFTQGYLCQQGGFSFDEANPAAVADVGADVAADVAADAV